MFLSVSLSLETFALIDYDYFLLFHKEKVGECFVFAILYNFVVLTVVSGNIIGHIVNSSLV
jgi:hypothetical protein